IKKAGFETLRIPITWHNHLDEDFTISEGWLDRVQEVVDYGIEWGLHVIINIHHDIDQKYYYPSPEYLESSKLYVRRIWEQLAKRFEDYDEELIFEAVNEPRMVGTTNEWWLDFSKQECVDSVQMINELNQVFVDTVRSSGAKNTSRYLLVPGYAASPEGVLNEYFIIPEDIEENEHRIILSVHAYRPYSFALQGPSEKGSTEDFELKSKQQVDEILNFMDELYEKYIAEGVPVLLGEFGARNKNNNLEDRVRFSSFYIKSALERGMAACWWDNYAFIGNGENFGLLDRRLNLWVYDEIVNAMMQYFE
ncbi:MAG: glycoside hydrolase family 5 protein, partial [Vallitaleaceae bacterium]|nr:glycoside hydrolase family 5 protein [Vallitaleaceae bacterium]